MKKILCLLLAFTIGTMLTGCTKDETELWNAFQKTSQYKSCNQSMTLHITADASKATTPELASALGAINGMDISMNAKAINDMENSKMQMYISLNTECMDIPFNIQYWINMDFSDENAPEFLVIYDFPDIIKALDSSLSKDYYYMNMASNQFNTDSDLFPGNPFDNVKMILDAMNKIDTTGLNVKKVKDVYNVSVSNDAFFSVLKQYLDIILEIPAYGLSEQVGAEEIAEMAETLNKLAQIKLFGDKDIAVSYKINKDGYIESSESSFDISVDVPLIASIFEIPDNTSTDKFTLGVSAKCEYSDYDSIKSIDFPTLTDENSADLLMLSIPDNYNDGINVTVNGSPVVFDVPPQLVNDRIMLPMRAVFEALGASVDYNDGVITAVSGGKTIIHTIGESTVYVNNEAIETDVPSFVTNGRTLVPLSFISEALGADVQWVEETQTVVITLN